MKTKIYLFIVLILTTVTSWALPETKVILLGTGTPYPGNQNQGPVTAVVYNNRVFLFDAGSGVMRQMNGANLPISGPEATFITHLHSDHTLGYTDLILTTWIMRRNKKLEVFGPIGLKRMTDLLLDAYSEDIKVRIDGLEKELPEVYKVNVHEINEGIVYDSADVKVTAFRVTHGYWKIAFGYRIDTPNKSIVISGDTKPSNNLIKFAVNCDILIHEVYAADRLKPEDRPGGEFWPQYCKEFHTSDFELGKIASDIKPGKLILTHIVRMGANDDELIKNIRKGGYDGVLIIGKDLEEIK
ncbi:MAG: MBL fold metallo-hydrolase [Ignavibacteria bacterium]|jgi:ribonuclease Z